MKSKKTRAKAQTVHVILGSLVICLIAVGVYSYWQYKSTSSQITVIEGPVTEKSPVIQNGGATITVNSVVLQVRESGLKPEQERAENFTMDIFSVKTNDIIKVHYLKTGDNQGTLNCKGCYIKKGDTIFKPMRNGREL